MAAGLSTEVNRSRDLGRRGWSLAIWLCLLAAFSPVLFDLSVHLVEHPWARASLIFPWLGWVATRSRAEPQDAETSLEPSRALWIWIALALGIEGLAIAGDTIRLGRLGLLIAVLGLCHSFRWMRFPKLLLLLWAIPIPASLMSFASPGLEDLWARGSAAMISGLAFELIHQVPTMSTAEGSLPLSAADGGLAMAFGFAGLGWFRGLTRIDEPQSPWIQSTLGAMAAVILQFALILLAGGLLRVGADAGWVRAGLAEVGWCVVVFTGFVLSVPVLLQSRRSEA